MSHTCNPSTPDAGEGRLPRIQNQAGLSNKYQANGSFVIRPFLKKKKIGKGLQQLIHRGSFIKQISCFLQTQNGQLHVFSGFCDITHTASVFLWHHLSTIQWEMIIDFGQRSVEEDKTQVGLLPRPSVCLYITHPTFYVNQELTASVIVLL